MRYTRSWFRGWPSPCANAENTARTPNFCGHPSARPADRQSVRFRRLEAGYCDSSSRLTPKVRQATAMLTTRRSTAGAAISRRSAGVSLFPDASFSNSFCMLSSANIFFSRQLSSSSALVRAIVDASILYNSPNTCKTSLCSSHVLGKARPMARRTQLGAEWQSSGARFI